MDSKLEERLFNQYGGHGSSNLPQTLMLDHVSAATRLLEKRRQMFEVQEALSAQKEEFNRREDAFRYAFIIHIYMYTYICVTYV
jgi:hypothetical protein